MINPATPDAAWPWCAATSWPTPAPRRADQRVQRQDRVLRRAPGTGDRQDRRLECRAIKRVREEIGLDNVIVMIPFCRTLEEADRALDVMAANGLTRDEHGLRAYVMYEIPSNVILAEEFAQRFDGFSIGSNDLTQLVLGVDRDSADLAPLFDERNEA